MKSGGRRLSRQKIRKALIIFSFVLMPVTFAYISCPIVTEGAAEGIVTGGLIVFILLFVSSLLFGRLWCGYLCPAGGLQEIYRLFADRPVKIGRLNLLKYLVFIGIFSSLVYAIYSSGGFSTVDIFYMTGEGVSIAGEGGYALLYGQIIFITFFALLAGRRGFCHYFCPIAVIMIVGRKVRNLFRWPAIHLSADAELCTDCKKCNDECPMSLDVNVMVNEGRMEHTECIMCNACTDACPEGAIRMACSEKK